jgi:hypothetical protein
MPNGRNQGRDRWHDADDEAPTYYIDRRTVLQTTGTGLAGLAAFSETTTAQSTSVGGIPPGDPIDLSPIIGSSLSTAQMPRPERYFFRQVVDLNEKAVPFGGENTIEAIT